MVASAAQPSAGVAPRTFGPLAVAGFASIGAGAIHAAAAAAHGDTRQAALVFQVLALAQIGWGAWATIGERRLGAALGALLSAGAVVGWAYAQTVGVSFIDGMEDPHGIDWADGIGAALAFLAFAMVARWLLTSSESSTRRNPTDGMLLRLGGGVVVAVLALGGVSQTAGHGGDHGHDDAAGGHGHEAPVVPPVAYDPEATSTTIDPAGGSSGTTTPGKVKRVDLSGVPGVSAQQQEDAEQLVEVTLDKLPQFADVSEVEALGFRSIGDGFTGHEHFINWNYIDDDKVLDPDYPESLVFDTSGPEKKLVSAMFMMPQGSTLDSVPEVGGPLTQWHIHDDLCFTTDEEQPRIAGVTAVGGSCTPPLQKFTPVPMIHVWIVAHPCGPFAALEGVAAGQVKPGEEHLCTEEHGSGF
jgi:hypothetical protein